eukprot:scaffold192542_cov35-Tisochrysis_lutea.AAC.1
MWPANDGSPRSDRVERVVSAAQPGVFSSAWCRQPRRHAQRTGSSSPHPQLSTVVECCAVGLAKAELLHPSAALGPEGHIYWRAGFEPRRWRAAALSPSFRSGGSVLLWRGDEAAPAPKPLSRGGA